MKVCIVAEGCYPYVVGGVSGWINSMIKSFPNIEFILLTIVANRSVRGKFVYELPENLTQVYELYLEDCEWEEGERERKVRKRFHLSKKERTELTNLVMNRKIEWGVIFDLFQRKGVSFRLSGSVIRDSMPISFFRISCGRCDRSICRFSGH